MQIPTSGSRPPFLPVAAFLFAKASPSMEWAFIPRKGRRRGMRDAKSTRDCSLRDWVGR